MSPEWTAAELPHDPLGRLLDLGVGGWRETAEAYRPTLLILVHAIEHDRVEVKIEIQRVTEALDKSHTAAIVASEPVSVPRPMA
jgi:hypothetical protein